MARHAPDARLLAGGTDLLVDLKAGRVNVGHIISINRIDDLRGVSATQDGLRIGALATPNQLAAAPVVQQRFAPILDAVRQMAAPQIRNMATVGGNVASAVPSADLPPILTVMNAFTELWSLSSDRQVPLDSFFLGPRQTAIHDDELLTAILVPYPPPGSGAAYARFALRAANACAVAGVAAGMVLDEKGTICDARIALCAVAPTPCLAEAAGHSLIGKPPDESRLNDAAALAMKAAEPISDIRASAEYRRKLVGVLARRALTAAWQRAREAQT
jgi:carbon-monoxide dehydrogenase medium subunit